MKKSDELFKQALSAKADETAFTKSRVGKMIQHSSSNKEALENARKLALQYIENKRLERVNEMTRQLGLANSDADEQVRQISSMFQQLLDQEEARIADYTQLDNEISGFETKAKRNSSETPKLQVIEEKKEKTGTN